MANKDRISEEMKDEHVDMLIRMAFQREEERAYQNFMENEQTELTPEEAARREAVFAGAMEKLAAQKKRAAKAEFSQKYRHYIPRIVNIAACIVLMICIAAPIAIANVESVRVGLMKLLIEIQDDHARISLTEGNNAESQAPDDWKGEYFPTYLPEGFEVSWNGKRQKIVVWRSPNEDFIQFNEGDYDDVYNIDSEGAEFSNAFINGMTGVVLQNNEKTIIILSDGLTYFSISSNLSYDECMKMAVSVKKVE